jgi:hypothetical protein
MGPDDPRFGVSRAGIFRGVIYELEGEPSHE